MLANRSMPRVQHSAKVIRCPTNVVPRLVTSSRPSVVARSTMIKDATSGVEFPVAQQFWDGEVMRCLGSGTRNKKILLLNVKVYSCSVYVEADKAAKELGVRQRGGFFENDDDYCTALLDGAFNKTLLIRLVRDVDGETFAEALNKSLQPRMQLAGELNTLESFKAVFNNKSLRNGTEVALLWNTAASTLDVLVCGPNDGRNYEAKQPERRISSLALCRSLFEIFLGGESVVPAARKQWVSGAKKLLESENVKREANKTA